MKANSLTDFEVACTAVFGAKVCVEIAGLSSLPPSELREDSEKLKELLSNETRRQEWLLAKKVIQKVLARLGDDSQRSAPFSHPRVSVSHSGELAAAVGISRQAEICGIGIDIESRASLDTDLARGLSEEGTFRLWTIKEALFKADPENGKHLVDDYVIESTSPLSGHACSADPSPSFHFSYVSMELEFGIVTVAVALRSQAQPTPRRAAR